MSDFGFGRSQRQQRYNGFNRQVNGPEQMNGSRAVQGEITVNVPFATTFAESRKGGELDGMKRLGLVTDPSKLNIYEGQLLVRQTRSRVGNNRNKTRGDPVFNAFSSFVGLPVYTDDIQDPVRWKGTWMFAGIAKSNIEMNEPIGTNEVAAAMGGAMTIQTNGVMPILPGNYLKFVVPSPDVHGDMMLHKMAEDAKVMHDPYAVTVVPEQPEDGVHFLSTLLVRYARNFVLRSNDRDRDLLLMSNPDRRAGRPSGRALQAEEHFLVDEYIDGSVEDFALNIALAIRLGLVTGNLPTNPQQLNGLANSLDATLKTPGGSAIRIDTTDQPRVINQANASQLDPASAASTAIKKARMEQVDALYSLLGLKNGGAVSKQTRQVVMLHRARGLIPPAKDLKSLQAHLSVVNVGGRAAGGGNMLTPEEKAMDLSHLNRSRESYMSFHSAYAFQAANRFARSLTSGKPGSEVDAIM
jgi:hypothetical protein